MRAANSRVQGAALLGPSLVPPSWNERQREQANRNHQAAAKLRSGDPKFASFAYDCAAADQTTVWNQSHHHIVASHPGFHELKVAEPFRCRGAGGGRGKEHQSDTFVQRISVRARTDIY